MVARLHADILLWDSGVGMELVGLAWSWWGWHGVGGVGMELVGLAWSWWGWHGVGGVGMELVGLAWSYLLDPPTFKLGGP